MPMYAIALKPLMDRVNQSVEVTQAWYADDAAATSDIPALHRWWEELTNIGPAYGYMVNASKTHLIVKASQLSEAQTTFEDTQINITTIGKPHLLGSQEFTESFVRLCIHMYIPSYVVSLWWERPYLVLGLNIFLVDRVTRLSIANPMVTSLPAASISTCVPQ